MDFRGRVYPVPPHLNHLSSDLGRSLLLFANGKPLGPHGLDWLKLHVINLTNLKRTSSLKERLEYANENIENILDSASNPLTVSYCFIIISLFKVFFVYVLKHTINL